MASSPYDSHGSPEKFPVASHIRNLLLLYDGRILPCFPSEGIPHIPGRYLPAARPEIQVQTPHFYNREDCLNLSAYCGEPRSLRSGYLPFLIGYSPGSAWQNRCLSQYT